MFGKENPVLPGLRRKNGVFCLDNKKDDCLPVLTHYWMTSSLVFFSDIVAFASCVGLVSIGRLYCFPWKISTPTVRI